MNEDTFLPTSVSLKPSSGTATLVHFPSVIPKEKRDKEVFWTKQATMLLGELNNNITSITSCEDDSNGNHDTIINLRNNDKIGVQITELTSELEKTRKSNSDKFYKNVMDALKKREIYSERKLLIEVSFKNTLTRKFSLPGIDEISQNVENIISGKDVRSRNIETKDYICIFRWVDHGNFLCGNENGIGLSLNLDSLPRNIEMYEKSVSLIRKKKDASKSQWLIIFSDSFWKDKPSLGKGVLNTMKLQFKDSNFERVYFIESMNGEGIFQKNIELFNIKE